MDTERLQRELADAIENVGSKCRQLGELAASVTAIRLAMCELSPERFEAAYQRHLEGPKCEGMRRESALEGLLLTASAQTLREAA